MTPTDSTTPWLAGLALLLAATASTAVNAQPRDGEALTAPFNACGAIVDNAARLACFDAALAALPRAQEAAAERSEAEIIASFGLPSGETAAPGPSAEVDPATTLVRDEDGKLAISSRVADVLTATGRLPVILLENGQLWRQGGQSGRGLRPRAGLVATVTPSGFGGYRMRFEGRTGFLSVTRIR